MLEPVRAQLPFSTTAKLAVAGLLGSLLISLSTSTLGGMTHLVTCTSAIDQTFSITAVDAKRAIVTGSAEVVRRPPKGECSAVDLNMVVRPDGRGYVRISMPVTNRSSRTWRASVKLRVGRLRIPVPIGSVRPGRTVSKELRIRLTKDLQVVDATLLIGPD